MAGNGRVVGAAEDAMRVLPGKDAIDAGHTVAMSAEAAHQR
jgi:hypothetical protein